MSNNEYPVTECAKCALPAAKHDMRTGLTHHLDPRKQPCKTAPAQPAHGATSGKR